MNLVWARRIWAFAAVMTGGACLVHLALFQWDQAAVELALCAANATAWRVSRERP